MSAAKLNILKKIKQALVHKVPVPFFDNQATNNNVFQPSKQELEIAFAANFSGLQGRFSYCADQAELVAQLSILFESRGWENIYCREEEIKANFSKHHLPITYFNDLSHCDVAITGCEFLVARTGSILLSSAQQSGRTVSVYAPVHICIASTKQLVYDIDDSLMQLRDKYNTAFPSMVSLASGPSRTADIEKTLVVGVHGPKEVFCFLIDE